MLRQKDLTLNQRSVSSQYGFVDQVKLWLNHKNQCFSEISGLDLTNGKVSSFLLGTAFAALGVVFLLDQVALYGWSAFLLLSAANLTCPVIRQLIENMQRDEAE